MRYHGSKEELFAVAARLGLRVPDLVTVPLEGRIEALVRHFLDRSEGPAAGDELSALLHAAATHEVIRQRLIELVDAQAAPLIAKASHDEDPGARGADHHPARRSGNESICPASPARRCPQPRRDHSEYGCRGAARHDRSNGRIDMPARLSTVAATGSGRAAIKTVSVGPVLLAAGSVRG